MSGKDVASFDEEVTSRLRKDRTLFISEIYEIGAKYGLTKSKIAGRLKRLNDQGIAFADRVYDSNQELDTDQSDDVGSTIAKKLKDYHPSPYGQSRIIIEQYVRLSGGDEEPVNAQHPATEQSHPRLMNEESASKERSERKMG